MSRIGILTALVLCLPACAETSEVAPALRVQSATVEPPRPVENLGSTVELEQFVTPNHAARPQDVVMGRDGAVWFSEADANAIGRLDPRDGTFRDFSLPEGDSRPQALAVDRDGNVWFTANARGYIGKLDPASGGVTTYRMPDAQAKDPHSLVFARDGSLWFTLLAASSIGRLDPATGQIRLLTVDRPGAQPYDIVIGRDDAPYVCDYGLNLIARVDPTTMALRHFVLPAGTRARGLALAGDGSLFYTDFGRGMIARLDPSSGVVQEWASPGGFVSRPYALAITRDGAVWYSESGLVPNTIVHFDPAGGAFTTMKLPADAGVVRSLYAAPDGRVLVASGNDRLMVLKPHIGAVASR